MVVGGISRIREDCQSTSVGTAMCGKLNSAGSDCIESNRNGRQSDSVKSNGRQLTPKKTLPSTTVTSGIHLIIRRKLSWMIIASQMWFEKLVKTLIGTPKSTVSFYY